MKFKVSRTSVWDDTPPCEECHAEYFLEANESYDKQWFINFETLEELMAFVKKYGECVIRTGYIEIYDDWRE